MAEYDLCFSPSSTDIGSFKLIELPKDLCTLIENEIDTANSFSLKVKGRHGEDAVLCTHDKTFTMRSVGLSNSVLIVTSPPDVSSADFSDDAVVICDQVNEIIELVPSIPKLHILSALLRGREYDDREEEDDMLEGDVEEYTYEEALGGIQASDAELNQGIKDRRILNMNGKLRPIAPNYLHRLLELILNTLVALSVSHEAAPVEELSSTLASEHEIPRAVSIQVMSWFGEIVEGKWVMNVPNLVKEVGLGILKNHTSEPIHEDVLMKKWKSIVGDTFESRVDLSFLEGNCLASSNYEKSLIYFPVSSLPVDAAARFADLFLIRPRWKAKDISPFLTDIALDSKERDKLLLKFARATTDIDGAWYTPRAQYNG